MSQKKNHCVTNQKDGQEDLLIVNKIFPLTVKTDPFPLPFSSIYSSFFNFILNMSARRMATSSSESGNNGDHHVCAKRRIWALSTEIGASVLIPLLLKWVGTA